jgi:glycosyltransferase involved in cell wall biosynthesis
MEAARDAAPRYSVVIPAYNAQATLGATLAALAEQTVPRAQYEIIVVDDGSTDGTAAIAQAGADRYLSQANAGPATARNQGAAQARGGIILFTDSDCEPAPDWLEQMVAPLADLKVSAVKGAYRTRQDQLSARFAQAEFEDRYQLLQKHADIDMVDTYAAAFRRQVFSDMNGFDQSFSAANNEDTELSYRLVAAGHRLVFAPKAIVFHRHPTSFKKYLRTKFWRGYWRLVVYRRFPDKAVKDTYTPLVLKLQTLAMAGSLGLIPPALVWPRLWGLVGLAWAGILVSALPFAFFAARRDPAVGLISPLVVLARAGVFALGSLYGLARTVLTKSG